MEAAKALSVLLVDDLALVRQGIRAVLAGTQDIRIVGETGDTDEAVRLSRALRPDVVLMDQDVKEQGDGLEAARSIKQLLPEVEVIVLTDRLDDAQALLAVEVGAMGYILKDVPGPVLAAAIRSVRNGRAFLHPEMTRKLMAHLARLAREQRAGDRTEPAGLTQRELAILMQVARGHTDQEIAAGLIVTEGTVKTHIRHVLRKLSARNRAQAVAYVLRKGLIE